MNESSPLRKDNLIALSVRDITVSGLLGSIAMPACYCLVRWIGRLTIDGPQPELSLWGHFIQTACWGLIGTALIWLPAVLIAIRLGVPLLPAYLIGAAAMTAPLVVYFSHPMFTWIDYWTSILISGIGPVLAALFAWRIAQVGLSRTTQYRAVAVLLILIVSAALHVLPQGRSADPALLTVAQRRQYDVVFFNEFDMRTQTRAPEGPNDCSRREQLFRRMAEDGYPVAGVALRLFKIGACDKKGEYDPELHRQLETLIDMGDTAAMCFIERWLFSVEPLVDDEVLHKYVDVVSGAALQGHPACLWAMSLRYELGAGVFHDSDKALRYRLAAARAGSLAAQIKLTVDHLKNYDHLMSKKPVGSAARDELAATLCWLRAVLTSEAGKSSRQVAGYLTDFETALRQKGLQYLIDAQDERERVGDKVCDR